MAYIIPSVPDHLVVKTADTKEGKEHTKAMEIYDYCLKQIAIGDFPFYVRIYPFDKNHKHIVDICSRLTSAGYKAETTERRERKWMHGEGEYEDVFWVIKVAKP